MSATAWNLQRLQEHIRVSEQLPEPLLELVQSISRSTDIFRFHLFNARDALKGVINESDPGGPENLMLVLVGSDKQEEYEAAKISSEAHLIGCFHAARSMADIFSHLLNGLLLSQSIGVRQCDIHKVTTALPESDLKVQLDSLLSSHWFKYVSAFLNTTKHRCLVKHSMSISFVENRVGAQIGAFKFNDDTYQTYWVHEALEGVLTVKNALVALGCTLNAQYVGPGA
jgi:hypothetical protein